MITPNTLLQNRYLVLKQIGQGGMGAVYIATDQRFGSTVALKETLFTDPGLRKAFEREARLLNHLRHPALPRVSDHFVEEDGQFLVMEFIAGDDLAEKLQARGGAFPPSEVLTWADQLLDALDYLHTHEPPVIHRDIKPQNLKLTARQHIVLLDFGLAKGTSVQTKVTATGSVFGYSRNYAPLEQIQGAGTDPRSDLYSLGATLYHLITGVTPPDALTRATAVLNGHPDPLRPANEVHAPVAPAVAAVISRAMAQNAGQRPQSAAAMRDEMRDAARQAHTTSRETIQQAPASTDVYEQETQLMFASAPTTNRIDAEDGSGTVNAEARVTGVNSAAASESVVTKVAASERTTIGNHPRKRIFAIAAGVALLLALAAGVYTFTRNSTPASNNQEAQVEPSPPVTTTPEIAIEGESIETVVSDPQVDASPTEAPVPPRPARSTRQTGSQPAPKGPGLLSRPRRLSPLLPVRRRRLKHPHLREGAPPKRPKKRCALLRKDDARPRTQDVP